MDNEDDRLVLVTQDLALRGNQITFAHTKSSKSTKISNMPRRNEKEPKISLCHLMNDRYTDPLHWKVVILNFYSGKD